MPVRKTENRLPAGLQPSDLGQAIAASDGRCTLVSFITSPLVVDRDNFYVLFVTDSALASNAQSFEWTFTENDETANVQSTQFGEIAYQPQSTGALVIKVRILDAGNNELASLALTQYVGTLQPQLEALISSASEAAGPGIGNPDVVRELVNDYSVYYQAVSLQSPEQGDAFQHFLFSIVFDGALRRTPTERRQHVENLAAVLNNETGDFAALIVEGVGVCAIRLALLAMTTKDGGGAGTPLLSWIELPDVPDKRGFVDAQLCEVVADLGEDTRIDLFNVARFPKSNVTACGRIVEALRDRYFRGTSFSDVLTGMAGTRAQWIVRHYREGPLSRS
jgi:hypothetical protein